MRVTRLFLDVDLRQSFDGLRKVVDKVGVPLGPESCVLFINRKCTSFKMLKGNKYIVTYIDKKRIPFPALKHLPAEFGGTDMEMSQAIEKSLREDAKVKFL